MKNFSFALFVTLLALISLFLDSCKDCPKEIQCFLQHMNSKNSHNSTTFAYDENGRLTTLKSEFHATINYRYAGDSVLIEIQNWYGILLESDILLLNSNGFPWKSTAYKFEGPTGQSVKDTVFYEFDYTTDGYLKEFRSQYLSDSFQYRTVRRFEVENENYVRETTTHFVDGKEQIVKHVFVYDETKLDKVDLRRFFFNDFPIPHVMLGKGNKNILSKIGWEGNDGQVWFDHAIEYNFDGDGLPTSIWFGDFFVDVGFNCQ